jgi:hypothetical protein
MMRYTIEKQAAGYLKAEMVDRDTSEETAQFVNAIVEALRKEGARKLLISTRQSRPVFKVEDWKLTAALDQVMSIAGLKVAFVSDTRELAMSQDYIALLGRQRGLEFQAFGADEGGAIAWLTSSSSS